MLWYGTSIGSTPAVPGGGTRPSSADETETMLNASVAQRDEACLRDVVLDVSRPGWD